MRREPERLVDLGQRALVIALLVVVDAEHVAHARMPRIEPKAFGQIRPGAIDVAFPDVGGGATGIGAGDFRIEPERLVVVGDGAVPVALEADVGGGPRDVDLREIAAAQRIRRDHPRAGGNRIIADPPLAGLHVIGPRRRGGGADQRNQGRSECRQQAVHALLPEKE